MDDISMVVVKVEGAETHTHTAARTPEKEHKNTFKIILTCLPVNTKKSI